MAGCAGIDVSKDHLDWTLDSGGEVRQVPNTPAGVRRLVRKLRSLELDRVVLEATGGYERLLFQALSDAGVPVVRINPKRARDFGKGMGVLAKNDAIDARLLALYGAKVEPKLVPARSERERRMGELAARRRQLIQMITMEKNRREQMPRWLRADQESLIRILENRVEKIDSLLDAAIAEDAEQKTRFDRLQTVPGSEPKRPGRFWRTSPSSGSWTAARSRPWPGWRRSPRTVGARAESEASTEAALPLARRSTWPLSSPPGSTRRSKSSTTD
ncbi:MAG: transposase [Deltaproteobacteria bacterium]|nr:transposase [Deltaproteobacteria bacterium]